MSWPLSQDYNEAVQSPRGNFSDPDLQQSEAVTNSLGIPMPRSGNFADVYEMRCPGGDRWAVKCFTREMPRLRERYAAISRHLQDAKLPFTVDFTFLEQGMCVRGRWYPVLKMQWVEGLTLNEFVRQYADKPPMLKNLLQIWVRMAARLREAGIAHADLQHGNVLLVPGSTANSLAVKLVDYDGMFVPALAGGDSGEVGHPCYQHPQRLSERTYSLEVDRFPLLLVATALDCLKVGGRALWDKYDSGDNLLFREADLREPVKSRLFYELLKLGDERAPRLVRQTLDALKGRLESVPLLEEALPELHVAPAPKPATSKRTTVIKAMAAQPAAESAEAGSAWAFEGEGKDSSRRQRKGGLLRWVGCAAAVGVAALVLAGGIFALALWNEPEKPKDKEQIAHNQHEKPPQRLAKSQEKVAPKEKQPEGDGQQKDDAVAPPPATPETVAPPPAAPEAQEPPQTLDKPKPEKLASTDKLPPLLKAPFSEAEAKEAQAAWAKYLSRKVVEEVDLGGGVTLELVLIPPGTFEMGSPKDEKGRNPWGEGFDVEKQHEVEISKPFYMAKYPVTQKQYQTLMKENPSYFQAGKDGADKVRGLDTDQLPVEWVSWYDAQAFCQKMRETNKQGRKFRLPSEAEWEYACRAGTTTPFYFGSVLNGKEANCDGNNPYGTTDKGPFKERTTKVGEYGENKWGLCDMHGNVWQWCEDYYGPYELKATDPLRSVKHFPRERRVLRGGGWGDVGGLCRAAFRNWRTPDVRFRGGGFRVAFRPEMEKSKASKVDNPTPPVRPVADKDGFISLFNGKDLTGWKTHSKQPGNWRVEKGILIGSGRADSYLYTDRGDYKDFHLRAEARINDGGNSGVCFRTPFGPQFPADNPQFLLGYEAQINSTHTDLFKTGSLHAIPGGALVSVRESPVPPGAWFMMEVIAEGNHIVIKVNGKTTVTYTDEKRRFASGYLAVQQYSPQTVAEFRKIEIKELPAKTAEPSPSRAKDNPPPEAKEVATKAYEKACKDARAKLLKAFDAAVDQLAKRKGSTEARLKLIEAVKEEKQRFEKSGLIPWSEPMRPYLAQYFTTLAAAEGKLRRVYEALIDAQLRAKNESKVADLRAELKNRIDVRVMAKWNHFVNGRLHHTVVVYSNGTIDNVDGKATWSYAKGVLTFRWPDPNAPGGAWIPTLNVSADGTTYDGTNNQPPNVRPKLTGVYVKDN